MLQDLQGRKLNYYAYARDTPKGKDCECTLMLARASVVWLPNPQCQEQGQQQQEQQQAGTSAQAVTEAQGCPCLAVELVGNRFLRRMVRVLVGTVVREAVVVRQQQQQQQQLDQGRCDQLLQLADGMDRRATAGPAPALGLCFADAGYDTFVGN
jgi:tRNA U38,U39,U40 pseudouridine synthase TruA